MDSTDTKRNLIWAARGLTYLVYFLVLVAEIILALGFFLLLFGANPSSSFVRWAYRNLDRVMDPFRGIFEPVDLGTTSGDVPAIFDASILFAMLIYGIAALALSALIDWLSYRMQKADRERAAEEAQHAAEVARSREEEARARAAVRAQQQPQTQAQPQYGTPQGQGQPAPQGQGQQYQQPQQPQGQPAQQGQPQQGQPQQQPTQQGYVPPPSQSQPPGQVPPTGA